MYHQSFVKKLPCIKEPDKRIHSLPEFFSGPVRPTRPGKDSDFLIKPKPKTIVDEVDAICPREELYCPAAMTADAKHICAKKTGPCYQFENTGRIKETKTERLQKQVKSAQEDRHWYRVIKKPKPPCTCSQPFSRSNLEQYKAMDYVPDVHHLYDDRGWVMKVRTECRIANSPKARSWDRLDRPRMKFLYEPLEVYKDQVINHRKKRHNIVTYRHTLYAIGGPDGFRG